MINKKSLVSETLFNDEISTKIREGMERRRNNKHDREITEK